jgi:GNAT superfamily N-acetyltransferase
MPTLPPTEATDEGWRAFAEERCEELKPHVAEFILERFTYKPMYVQQRVWRTFATVSALSLQFDIYIRMFVKPNDYWPRECLVLARIGFTKERVGHGRALVQRLVELAPQFGYRYLAIEAANANASPALAALSPWRISLTCFIDYLFPGSHCLESTMLAWLRVG